MKKPCMLSFLVSLFTLQCWYCISDIGIGYKLTLTAPLEYTAGFVGKAYLTQTDQTEPTFKAALTIDALEGKYSCSLQVFLGDVKVWNSGHYTRFYISEICVIELTKDGDLQLKDPSEKIGWRTGTAGQGVERLQMLSTGNLVLVDALSRIRWQTFNFPTDVMLWGQRLDVATRLTSFPSNSSFFYSFEVQHDRIALYVNTGKQKYSYWEFRPSGNRNLNFVRLSSKGLELFNDYSHKIAQIQLDDSSIQPLRFLALGNRTGNLGLYSYSPDKGKFQASFQALNLTCDLPLACKPYGICTFSNACSCIRVPSTEENEMNSDCGDGMMISRDKFFCEDRREVEMLELNGVTTVLKDGLEMGNVNKEKCVSLCMNDCKCAAALYSSGERGNETRRCCLYGIVMGVKQVDNRSDLSYAVKIPKGSRLSDGGKSGLKKWVLILVGGIDGLVILLVLAGFAYYLIRKKRKNSSDADTDS